MLTVILVSFALIGKSLNKKLPSESVVVDRVWDKIAAAARLVADLPTNVDA